MILITMIVKPEILVMKHSILNNSIYNISRNVEFLMQILFFKKLLTMYITEKTT